MGQFERQTTTTMIAPLQVRRYARFLNRGAVVEDGKYWDSDGALVALSRQTALVRVPVGSQ